MSQSGQVSGYPSLDENDQIGLENIEEIRGGDQQDAIIGSPGADVLSGGGGPDTIDGRGGADRLTGGDGDDRLMGGADADTLDGRAGADVLDGGAGTDRAIYTSSPGPVHVTLDDTGTDGVDGERDDVRSTVENVVGSRSATR